ncbi:hypothetical protein DITRI_Ditri08aG0150900 [Diplodiscus trichospermus]
MDIMMVVGRKGSCYGIVVKWTEQMVNLVVNAVYYVAEDASSSCLGVVRRKLSMSQKIGKWKCVSKVMDKGLSCIIMQGQEQIASPLCPEMQCALQLSLRSRGDDEPNQSRLQKGLWL